MSRMRSAWLPGLCLCPLGRGRHSRGKVACLAHPPHTNTTHVDASAFKVRDAMDTTGRTFGAAATKHFESARRTSERNQRAAEQRVGVRGCCFAPHLVLRAWRWRERHDASHHVGASLGEWLYLGGCRRDGSVRCGVYEPQHPCRFNPQVCMMPQHRRRRGLGGASGE